MANLSRVNWIAQQRMDLHHLLGMESYTAFDFRAMISAFSGKKAFILRGFEVVGKTGLSISISVKDSMVFNPTDGNGSFYAGLSTDPDTLLELPAESENLFVEAVFKNVSTAPINTSYWDPLALTGDDVAGTEYPASTNSQVTILSSISVNTVGFSDNAYPILRASTDGSNITKMIDCRPMFFRLGSGGTSPDSGHKFPWGTQRQEPVASGIGVGDAPNSPFRSKDASGILNDKGITTFKEWADAVMTRISEIAGSSIWYTTDTAINFPLYGYVTGLDVPRIFLDSESGHCIQASSTVSFRWGRNGGNQLVLKTHGPVGTVENQSTIRWQVNYGPVTWQLGGKFLNDIPGGRRDYSESRFESPSPVDGGNLYLLLERDIVPPLSSGNAVQWADNNAESTFVDPLKTVSGVSGDFTGIAVGDWVRKESEGFSQYYRVVRISAGAGNIKPTIGAPNAIDIADSTTVALELDRKILTGASSESMLYFRSRYSQDDLFADRISGQYNYRDSNYYWLGRRTGDTFMLRGYGNMQEGEETLVREDAATGSGRTGGAGSESDLTIQHANGAVYNDVDGYSLRAGTPDLIKIRRRKRDNLVSTPTSADNSGGFIEYTIASPVGLMNEGDGLWVRLSDVVGGALVPGSVTNSSDDEQNTDVTTNKWQVRSAAQTPLRDFDNKDVMLLARRVTQLDGSSALLFLDGSMLDWYGITIDQFLNVTSDVRLEKDVYLQPKTPKSVLFIDQNPDAFNGKGRIDEDNISFNYDKAAQELKLFNNVFGVNYHRLVAPIDQNWFVGLGAHTLTLGDGLSNIVIPGDLTVLGVQTIVASQEVAIADKQFILGVGNPEWGGSGSGLYVADNTLKHDSFTNFTTLFESYNGQKYIDVTFDKDPDYRIGQRVGVIANFTFNGLTAGDVSLTYVGKAVGAGQGDFERISPAPLPGAAAPGPATYRFWTKGTATASGTQVPDAVHDYSFSDLLSQIHMASSNHEYAASGQYYMTSWSFCVKRSPNNPGTTNSHIPALVTPYESAPLAQDFMTIPKGRQAKFSRTRIPFAWEDGVGSLGSDSTFDFSDRLTWDYNTSTFRVEGTIVSKGHILPEDDNTWDIGSTTKRWRSMHVGPGSVVVHNDITDAAKVSLKFLLAEAQLNADSASNLRISVGSNGGLLFGTAGQAAYNSPIDVNAIFRVGGGFTSGGIVQSALTVSPVLTGSSSNAGVTSTLHLPNALSSSSFAAAFEATDLVAGSFANEFAGLRVRDMSVAGTSYGIYGETTNVAGRWFVYGQGTGKSFFRGSVGFGNDVHADLTAAVVIGTAADTAAAKGLLFGAGLSNLYRSAADTLTTDGNFIVKETATFDGPAIFNDSTQFSAIKFKYNAVVTADYTVVDSDCVVPVDTSSASASINITLPLVTVALKGQVIVIKDVGGQAGSLNKNIVVKAAGGNMVEGSALSYILDGDRYSITLVCNGSDGWDVI
jgi:hypothetical protein